MVHEAAPAEAPPPAGPGPSRPPEAAPRRRPPQGADPHRHRDHDPPRRLWPCHGGRPQRSAARLRLPALSVGRRLGERTSRSVYHLWSFRHGHGVAIKVRCPNDDAHVPTVSHIWQTANWHERETREMYGIVFDGHPDLRPLLTEEGLGYYPLLKSHPLADIEDWQEATCTRSRRRRRAAQAATGVAPCPGRTGTQDTAGAEKGRDHEKARDEARAKGMSTEDEKAIGHSGDQEVREKSGRTGGRAVCGGRVRRQTHARRKSSWRRQRPQSSRRREERRESEGMSGEGRRHYVAEALKKFSEEQAAPTRRRPGRGACCPPPAEVRAARSSWRRRRRAVITKAREEARRRGCPPRTSGATWQKRSRSSPRSRTGRDGDRLPARPSRPNSRRSTSTSTSGRSTPATHGVFRMVLTVDGEIVKDVDPVIGYMHRGQRTLPENCDYRQVIGCTRPNRLPRAVQHRALLRRRRSRRSPRHRQRPNEPSTSASSWQT